MESGWREHPYKSLLKVSSRSTSRTLSRLYPSTKSLHGVMEDREVPDGAGDEVRVERTSIQIFAESFIKIQHQEPCQDSTRPPSLFMESWRTGRFLMELEMESGWREHPYKSLLKVSSRSNIRNLVKTLPIHQVSSWSLGGQGSS